MLTIISVLEAIIGGIVPSFVWLWFWLREDNLHPEPKRALILTFILGMMVVVIALPLEGFVAQFVAVDSLMAFLIWAGIEELCKYLAYKISKKVTKQVDEPIDPFIYLITAALGFAALENMLFLLEPISNSGLISGLLTGNMRFIGANLLHLLTSGTVGIALGFIFYSKKSSRFWITGLTLLLATLLHTFFNFFILFNEGTNVFLVFSVLWVLIIVLIGLCEKIKQIKLRSVK